MHPMHAFDIEPFLVNNNDPTRRSSDKYMPKNPFRSEYRTKLNPSIESLAEFELPSPSLDRDPEMSKLMFAGSYREHRPEVVSYASTYRESSPEFYLESDRDSLGSIHDEDFQLGIYHICQPKSDDLKHSQLDLGPFGRPESLLPESMSIEYRPYSPEANSLYSAPLRSSAFSNHIEKPHRTLSSKRSATPSELETLVCRLKEASAYDTSRSSSEDRPNTPTSSLLPSLSFTSSSGYSPSSVTTNESSQDMGHTDRSMAPVEQSKTKHKSALPRRLALSENQSFTNSRTRNISSPIPSPIYPDTNTAGAAALSYQCAPSRSHVPKPLPSQQLSSEISAFDFDSDDERGRFSHGVKKIKSAISLQNLSRTRSESMSQAPPLPSPALTLADRNSNPTLQRNSKGSLKLGGAKESGDPNCPPLCTSNPASSLTQCNDNKANSYFSISIHSHNRSSSETKSTQRVTKLQKATSVRSRRSNTLNSQSSALTPPPTGPLPPIPTMKAAAVKRQSRISWYSCFARAENTEADVYVAVRQHHLKRKANALETPSETSKVRMFLQRLLLRGEKSNLTEGDTIRLPQSQNPGEHAISPLQQNDF